MRIAIAAAIAPPGPDGQYRSEERRDVEEEVGKGRRCGQVVAQGAGEVEINTQPGHSLAAHGAERVDNEGNVIAAAEPVKAAPGKGLGDVGGGALRLPQTLAQSKLAGGAASPPVAKATYKVKVVAGPTDRASVIRHAVGVNVAGAGPAARCLALRRAANANRGWVF